MVQSRPLLEPYAADRGGALAFNGGGDGETDFGDCLQQYAGTLLKWQKENNSLQLKREGSLLGIVGLCKNL